MNSFFMYKDYPLVRNGNCIYYGYMSEPTVVMMQVMHQNQQDDLAVADKIKVYQISTDEKLNPMQATLQTIERDSLFDALDLANAWLRRAEKATQQEKKN